MLLLPGMDREQAIAHCESLRQAFQDESIPTSHGGDRVIRATISIGLSRASNGATSVDSLLREADEQLYEAKHNGRNRVSVAD